MAAMTSTSSALFGATGPTSAAASATALALAHASAAATPRGLWSGEEHDRFLSAMKLFPKGPWKAIADHIATRSVRQVQTHAQKYQEKVSRRLRGLRKSKKKLVRPEHRIDDATMELCKLVDCAAKKLIGTASPRIKHDETAAAVSTAVVSPTAAATAAGTSSSTSSSNSVLDLDASLKTHEDDLQPLPFADFDNIELDPMHFPTLTESLDFLIEYLSV